MSQFNICMHLGSFNISIKIDKDMQKRNTNISRKIEQKKRIKEAITTIQVNYNDLNNLF